MQLLTLITTASLCVCLLIPSASAYIGIEWWSGSLDPSSKPGEAKPNTAQLHEPLGCDPTPSLKKEFSKRYECTTFAPQNGLVQYTTGKQYFKLLGLGKSPVKASFPNLEVKFYETYGCERVALDTEGALGPDGTTLTLFDVGKCNRAMKGNNVPIIVKSFSYRWY